MLHKKSNHSVLIKKIYLKTWLMRDEIENVIQKKIQEGKQEESLNAKMISQEFAQQKSPDISKEKIYDGMCILSEINMNGICFFSSFHFMEGQSIIIELQIPNKFTISAEIAYSNSCNMKNKIISNQNFNYRIKANFTFLRSGERKLLRNFIASIRSGLQNETDERSIENQKQTEEIDNFEHNRAS